MSDKLKIADLFAGAGMASKGLHDTGGFETVDLCEIEPFAQRVLTKNFPKARLQNDVTTFEPSKSVDLVTAGFPCQDLSYAGKGAGLTGGRSGLYWHVLRTALLVGQPKLLLENVAALLNRGMGTVLGSLASVGYDSEWHCIPASAVGAPQLRDRVWIIAYSEKKWPEPCLQSIPKARRQRQFGGGFGRLGVQRADKSLLAGKYDELPNWLDRHCLVGNSLHPKIPEMIGHAILEAEATA